MKIDAKVRRLVAGSALAMRANSGVHNLGVDHWKAICALLFVRPKHFLKLIVHRLDSQAQSDSVVRPFARESLY
jgi:hypothetical protein